MRYPYMRVSPAVPLRPYLTIFLRSGYATTPLLYGLVDSGADYSIFPYDLATRFLKLNFSGSRIWTFEGTTGRLQIAYLAEVEINILQEGASTADFQFSALVGFCPDFGFGGGVLLGQSGFMSRFKTTFIQPENFFEIDPFQPELLKGK